MTCANRFPAPALPPIPSNGIIPNADLNQSYYVVSRHFREPYMESWNLAVERTLPRQFVLDVAYVGSHGAHRPANVIERFNLQFRGEAYSVMNLPQWNSSAASCFSRTGRFARGGRP